AFFRSSNKRSPKPKSFISSPQKHCIRKSPKAQGLAGRMPVELCAGARFYERAAFLFPEHKKAASLGPTGLGTGGS
ncbi:MAG: hypothetical protein II697_02505, partial [Clostridia bacterium]|nr:hypothetical protein [Clostridia bacterium]